MRTTVRLTAGPPVRPGRGDGEDAEGGGWRGYRAPELREHHVDRVERAARELRHQRRHQLARMRRRRAVADVDALRGDRSLREPEERDALLAHEMQAHGAPLPLDLLDAAARLADQVRVERAAQPAVGRDEQQ